MHFVFFKSFEAISSTPADQDNLWLSISVDIPSGGKVISGVEDVTETGKVGRGTCGRGTVWHSQDQVKFHRFSKFWHQGMTGLISFQNFFWVIAEHAGLVWMKKLVLLLPDFFYCVDEPWFVAIRAKIDGINCATRLVILFWKSNQFSCIEWFLKPNSNSVLARTIPAVQKVQELGLNFAFFKETVKCRQIEWTYSRIHCLY